METIGVVEVEVHQEEVGPLVADHLEVVLVVAGPAVVEAAVVEAAVAPHQAGKYKLKRKEK